MNEIVFGANLLPGMSSVLRIKVPSVITYRNIILEGRKYGGKESLEAGLVDAIVEGDKDKVSITVDDYQVLTVSGPW